MESDSPYDKPDLFDGWLSRPYLNDQVEKQAWECGENTGMAIDRQNGARRFCHNLPDNQV